MSNAMTTPTSSRGCGCGGSSSGARAYTGSTSKSGGCGCGGSCGGSGCSCGTSCSCGGAGCGLCQGQELVRPRFFAGQLLTEEDLDLLVNYVVEKNRLHNRSFFGQGVVCGLMVTCDPCGGGKVTVQPGYALDCCGNDIVVPCPQTLDVNLMVKQLRTELNGGVDCGDPCTDAKAKAMQPAADPAAAVDEVSVDPIRGLGERVPGRYRQPVEFCLYVRYCETPSDPVSPYASDDPCGAQACEPTRIREGFRFELRCKSCDTPEPEDMWKRIAECVGSRTAGRMPMAALAMGVYSGMISPKLARIDLAATPHEAFGADRAQELDAAIATANGLPAANSADWSPELVRKAMDASQVLAGAAATWHGSDAAARKKLPEEAKKADERLAEIKRRVPMDKLETLVGPVEAEVSKQTLEGSFQWMQPESTLKTLTSDQKLLAFHGINPTPQLYSTMSSSVSQVKATLLERIQEHGGFTDCELMRELQAIFVPQTQQGQEVGVPEMKVMAYAMNRTQDLAERFYRECICDAINPPCPPCDDPAVLLACLRVEDCDVLDICNMERTFVLTWPTMRYWIPTIRSIGQSVEQYCCPNDPCNQVDEMGNAVKGQIRQPLMLEMMAAGDPKTAAAPAFDRGMVASAFLQRANMAPMAANLAASFTTVPGTFTRSLAFPQPPAAQPAAPARPAQPTAPATPPPSVIHEVLKTETARNAIATAANDAVEKKLADVNLSSFGEMRDELADLRKKLAASERRVKKLEENQ